MMPNDVEMPGRLLSSSLRSKLQQCFVERFAPEMLPRVRPPYWGDKFQNAQLISNSYLHSAEFLQQGHVLCLIARQLPKPARKGEVGTYLCPTKQIAATLTSLHWSVRFDFYLFDKTYSWFIAALGERIYSMNDQGDYPLLVYRER